MNFNGTYTIANKFKATPTAINRECIGQYSVNCGSIQPEWQHNLRGTLDFGPANVSLLWRYTAGVDYERILAPRFNGAITGFGPLVGQTYNFNKISAFSYFDLSTGFKIMDNITLDMLVANLFDKKPPIVGSTLGTTGQNSGNTYPSTYDALGRRYQVTLGVRF
jgi:outer membrane receptor protein involved in Fe transport